MEKPGAIGQKTGFDERVDNLERSLDSADLRAARTAVGDIFPYVIHSLRDRNLADLKDIGKKLALINYLFDRRVKDPEIAQELGYLRALENVVRKMADFEVKKEIFQVIKKEPRSAEVLRIIKMEGVVEHQQLAEILGVSPDTLNEILKPISGSEAMTSTTYGKMRYYNLTDVGEAIYDRSRKQAFLPELARRVKSIYRLVIDEGKPWQDVLRLVKPEADTWCTEDEILPIIESFVEIREDKKAKVTTGPRPATSTFEEGLTTYLARVHGVLRAMKGKYTYDVYPIYAVEKQAIVVVYSKGDKLRGSELPDVVLELKRADGGSLRRSWPLLEQRNVHFASTTRVTKSEHSEWLEETKDE